MKRIRKNQPFRIARCFHDVVSSNLKRVYWSSKYRTLVVEFKESGDIYLYPDVSSALYRRLMKAESKGKYFHKYISSTHQGIPFKKEVAEIDITQQLEDSIKSINERRNKAS